MSGGPLPVGETATVDISLGTQTATDAVDYDAFLSAVSAAAALESGVSYSAGTLTFDSNFDGQFDFTVDAINDELVEGTETIVGTLSNATVSNGSASITTPSTTTNITEVDIAVSFAIDSTPSISEDAEETATFSVTMSGGPLAVGETATVDISLGTQTATDAVDYDAFLSAVSAAAALESGVSYSAGTLTFDSNFDGQFDFTVDAINDELVEGTETIVGTLSNATVSNGSATITTPSTATNITEVDAAVTFAVNVTSEDAANDSPTQSATIAEEVLGDNQGTFTISIGGDALTGSNTATVTITVSGSAEDTDFVGMSGNDYADLVAAIKAAAELAGLTVSNDDGDSLDVTWAAGDTTSFNVDLTAFDDDILDPESLTLTLSGPSVDEGSATLESAEEAATLNITDVDAEPTAGSVSALVDDEGLTDGIPGGDGDDTPDVDADNDESTYSGTLTFDFGDNGAGSIDFAEMHGDTGSLGTEDISYAWDGGTNTLTATTVGGSRPDTDLFTVTVNPATGAYTVTLLTNVLHESLDGVGGDNTENNDSVVLTYTVRDSDTDTADGTLTINFDDDTPAYINPTTAHVVDLATMPDVIENLNFAAGADGIGDVVFSTIYNGETAMDGDGNTLSYNGATLYLYTIDSGTTVVASTADSLAGVDAENIATTGYTVELNGDGTYTFHSNGVINNGTAVSSAEIGQVGGGNKTWKAFIDLGGTTEDAFLTTKNGDSVNTNNGEIGISEGNSFEVGEGYRIDFVNNLTTSGSGGGETFSVAGGSYNETNSFRQIVSKTGTGNSANILVTAFYILDVPTDALGDYYTDASDAADKITLSTTDIKVYDFGGNDVTGSVTISQSGDSVLIEGIQQDWTFEVNSDDAFNAIQIDAATGSSTFKLGVFSYGEDLTGDPLELSYAVTGTDGDGDSVGGTLDVVLYPDASTVEGTDAGEALNGTDQTDYILAYDGDDVLQSLGGDDVLIGGAGNDVMDGGAGVDTFVFSMAENTGNDTIINIESGDVLSFIDVLDINDSSTLTIDDVITSVVDNGDGLSVEIGLSNGGTIILDAAGTLGNTIDSAAQLESILGISLNVDQS